MAITAAQVKELRERTGSGMMECKKALVEAEGDMETAIETLRKTGLAKADKKACAGRGGRSGGHRDQRRQQDCCHRRGQLRNRLRRQEG